MTFESLAREMAKDARLREETLPPDAFADRIMQHMNNLSAADLIREAVESTSPATVQRVATEEAVKAQDGVTLDDIRD